MAPKKPRFFAGLPEGCPLELLAAVSVTFRLTHLFGSRVRSLRLGTAAS